MKKIIKKTRFFIEIYKITYFSSFFKLKLCIFLKSFVIISLQHTLYYLYINMYGGLSSYGGLGGYGSSYGGMSSYGSSYGGYGGLGSYASPYSK